nr:putative acetyltransferase [uncultured bacterium]
MGSSCIIRKPMMIIGPDCMELGHGISIREGARLEIYRASSDSKPLLRIGSNTNIEQNVHIVCHNYIEIGKDVSITSNCAIVDTTHPFDNISEETKVGEHVVDDRKTVQIGDGSFLGIGSIVLPGVRIGRKAIIGAHSVLTSDVPDYGVVAGVPARFLRFVERQVPTECVAEVME